MKKTVLCVLDGVGISRKTKGNAFFNANTPNINKLMKMYPNKTIDASGSAVGLPDGKTGNSEVGHLSLGAGRIVKQPLTLINDSITDGSFFKNEKLLAAISHAKKNKSKLHIMGLLSDGCVHSNIEHFKALIKLCSINKFDNVYFHVFTDGRDTQYNVALKYLDELQSEIDKYKIGKIASIAGRFYGMDRDKRWDRIEKAYNSIVFNEGEEYSSYKEAIQSNYGKNIYDEFIVPCIIDKNGNIENNDSIIWANYRPDRAIEILTTLSDKKFDEFKVYKLKNINLTTFMWVSGVESNISFEFKNINNSLGEVLKDYKQLRIAETEKYAHVTYFFDGLKDVSYDNEKKIIIPSEKVKTYDLSPKMKAKEITDTLIKEFDNNYDFVLVNYANADMVGHTGNYDATITAIEEIDKMIGLLYNKCVKNDYTLIITADHGNCETMLNDNGDMVTSHTTNKIPFIVCDDVQINIEKISEVAPFILNLMNLKIPDEMK